MPATWGPAVQLEPEVTLTSLCLLDTFNHCVSVSAKSHSGAGRLEENSTDTNPPELRLLPNKLPFPHSALSLISLLPSPLVLEILKSHFVGFQKKKGKWKPTQPILTALVKHPIPADRTGTWTKSTDSALCKNGCTTNSSTEPDICYESNRNEQQEYSQLPKRVAVLF